MDQSTFAGISPPDWITQAKFCGRRSHMVSLARFYVIADGATL